MAIYSTFFLCLPAQLQAGFPGWRPPLPQPVSRKVTNPFTRKEMEIFTRAPEWEGVNSGEISLPEYQVTSVTGDYEAYLENRIPAFVRSLPHWCAKNLTSLELEPLISVVTESDDAKMETPIYAHPSLSASVEQFPDNFISRLKETDEDARLQFAQEWSSEMSTPDYTHSISGERVSDNWTIGDAMGILSSICDLANQGMGGEKMYLLVEC
jgi:hypothetical protein